MGGEFFWGAAEMPPPFPTDISVNNYYLLCDDLRTLYLRQLRTVISDPANTGILDVVDLLALDVDDDEVEVFDDTGVQLHGEDAERRVIADFMCRSLNEYLDGEWDRYIGVLNTYTKEGRQRRLVISGEVTWGDVPEIALALIAFSVLPAEWWYSPVPATVS